MSGIFVASFGPTSRTTRSLGHTSRSARMRRWHAPSNRLAAWWCDPKSAVCTTATNGKPPDRVRLRWHATIAGCGGLPASSFDGISTRISMPARAIAYWGRRTLAFLGELTTLELLLSRGYGDGQLSRLGVLRRG